MEKKQNVVLVCGGRSFVNYNYLNKILSAFHTKFPIDVLVHGNAQGADQLADRWVREQIEIRARPTLSISPKSVIIPRIKIYPAKWNKEQNPTLYQGRDYYKVPPQWKTKQDKNSPHGKMVFCNITAGIDRNRFMFDSELPNYLFAFPGGKGTLDMIKYAKSENKAGRAHCQIFIFNGT